MCPSPSLTREHGFCKIPPCFHCSVPEGCNSDTFGSVSGLTESFGLVSGYKKKEHFFLHPQSHLMETIQLLMQKQADETISAGWAQIIQYRWLAQEPPCEDCPQQSSCRALPYQHLLLFQQGTASKPIHKENTSLPQAHILAIGATRLTSISPRLKDSHHAWARLCILRTCIKWGCFKPSSK